MTDTAGNASGCASGILCQRLAYDEYGQLSPGVSGTGEPFQFTGRRFDVETGLYYYRARYYAPQLGRFLQTDPVGYKDDVDVYTYVGNDPGNSVDPSGASSCTPNADGSLSCSSSGFWDHLFLKIGLAFLGYHEVSGNSSVNPGVSSESGPESGSDKPEQSPPATSPAPASPAASPPPEGDPEEDPNRSRRRPTYEDLARQRNEHGEQRAAEAQTNPSRQVGDANRVIREGRTYMDNDTGNLVHVNGDRVVITDENGNITTQFINTRANTLQRIQSGRWTPIG